MELQVQVMRSKKHGIQGVEVVEGAGGGWQEESVKSIQGDLGGTPVESSSKS